MKKSILTLPLSMLIFLCLGCLKKGEGQFYLDTTAIDTTTIIGNLDTPWEILWGPDNFLWFTERQGTVNRLNPDNKQHSVILTIQDVFEYGEGGLLGMALHPAFAEQPFVYLVYNYTSGSSIKERLVRYEWNGNELVNPENLIDGISANSYHNGSRLIFGPDGKLYMSTGDAGFTNNSQNMNSLSGKVLRINPDGSIPDDNPFDGSFICTSGHRNSQGLEFSPAGILYSSEHGPDTDDELNIIQTGHNYGWPLVTGYCDTPAESDFCNANNVTEPIAAWTPTLAVAGISYYTHSDISEWQNSLLVTSLKAGKLLSLKLSSDGLSLIDEHEWFVNHFGRLRDVCVSPDGRVFLTTSNRDGRGSPAPGDDRIIEIRPVNSTGLNNTSVQMKKIRLVPNPVDSEARIEFDNDFRPNDYSIYDLTGKMIDKIKYADSENTLRTDNLDPGFYLLKATGNTGIGVASFIVP